MLEINTLPGMTERSLLPQAATVHGFSYRQLCLEILARALERRAR
jgi:D-alanine-D-alanine ligase-like ATP-grasp enzyme